MLGNRIQGLSKKALRWYWTGRVLVFLIFFGLVMWVLLKTIFPDGGGKYDFAIYGANKNSLSDPVFTDGRAAEDGRVRASEEMEFSAGAHGDFTRVNVAFYGDFPQGSVGTLSLVRAYRAFLYPEGEPIVCPRGGSLVKIGEMYALASEESLRFFPSPASLEELGYTPKQFFEISESAVEGCARSEDILGKDAVEDMIASLDGTYFQFRAGRWHAFASERAFLSQFRKEDAIQISQEFFDRYPIAEVKIGFLGGMLVSYGESVYAVEGNTLRPVADPETFVTKGYAWEDILPLTDKEFGAYVIGDYYSRKRPHASGTIFLAEESGRMFVVENGTKREIANRELRSEFDAVRAIPASITPLGTCTLEPLRGAERCSITWDENAGGIGSEYRFQFMASKSVQLSEIHAAFVRKISRANFNSFAAEILARLGTRYPFLSQ